ncbi:HNH endonuclease [uncultured Methylobacterium sp.]|uniref:HNH endonuclease n=1 Tax=uncultured Methylobacterium sp. TaxID=157278 RepID=UPI0026055554|nr:HNH endonuclease [uncultured Methylobacterium sp.]
MAGSYKHDVAAWAAATGRLSDGAYRLYHLIAQLMVLGDGPISYRERGLAGRCNQTVPAFRKNLRELVDADLVLAEANQISITPTRAVTVWGRDHIPATLREAVLTRDDHTCVYCGVTDCPLEMDHVIPVSRGGLNTEHNLVASCGPCNRAKGAKLVEEWI